MSLITLFYRSIYTITDYKSSGRKGAQAKDEEVLVMEKVSGQKRKSRLRGWVFWPPFLVLLMVLILGFVSQDAFLKVVNGVKDWIWGNFKWLFSGYGLAAVGVCFYACFSKFGNTVIGGKDAKPILGKFNWFAISLCTTIAAGLMFWAAAEPLYLMSDPSPFFDIEPNSPQAAVFAMAQMYLHWGITPYAIYALAATVFAFTYYNMKKPFSLGACISPLLGERATKGRLADIIDALCIFILCAGMSGSLSTGALQPKPPFPYKQETAKPMRIVYFPPRPHSSPNVRFSRGETYFLTFCRFSSSRWLPTLIHWKCTDRPA